VLLHDAVNDLRCGIGVGDVQPDGVRCFPLALYRAIIPFGVDARDQM
jgi:hypothetical protein